MLLLWTNWLWLSPVSQSQKLSSLHLCHRFCSNAILSETICGRKSWPRTLKAFLPFIEAELEIVFPGPYKVPTPISSCIFEGWCHYSTTTPCTIYVLGEACGLVASKMSLAAKGAGELVCQFETCGVDPKGPELAKNNDDPKLYTSIFNLDLYLYIYIYIHSI